MSGVKSRLFCNLESVGSVIINRNSEIADQLIPEQGKV